MTARLIRCAFAILLCPAFAAQARSHETGEIEALIETLENEERRAALIGELHALVAASGAAAPAAEAPAREPTLAGAALVDAVAARVDRVNADIGAAATALRAAPEALAGLWSRAGNPVVARGWGIAAAWLLLTLVGALAAARAAARLVRPARAALAQRRGGTPGGAMMVRGADILLAFLPVALFVAAAWAVAAFAHLSPPVRSGALGLLHAAAMVAAVRLAADSIFASAAARLPPWLPDAATTLAQRLTFVLAFGAAAGDLALLLGLSAAAHATWLRLVGLAATGVLAAAVMRNRRHVAAALRLPAAAAAAGDGDGDGDGDGEDGTDGGRRDFRADNWHRVALLVLAVLYIAWALRAGGSFGFLPGALGRTAALALAALLLYRAVRRSRAGFALWGRRYEGWLRTACMLALGGACALLLAEIWIGGAFAWLASAPVRALAAHIASIGVVVGGALLIWAALSAFVARAARDDSTGVGRRSRLRTLLPLLRNGVGLALGVMVTLTVLAEIGVNIGPLLAGVGIAGVAIGFGAQSLVKDVITGVFILLEDSVAVGDVVDVASHIGTVEHMTIRALRLRDLSGDVHVVPFGEISTVRNMTRDFSYAMIDAGVGYREDADRVIGTLHEIAEEMRDDPLWGPDIVAPLDVLGVDSLGDFSVNIRARLKVLPVAQWRVRREFNRRMKRRFDEEGIEIPYPYRTVIVRSEAAPRPRRDAAGEGPQPTAGPAVGRAWGAEPGDA